MAITLPANKWLGVLSNLIGYSQTADTMERGSMNRFINSCQNINTPDGDGKIILAADVPKVLDLSDASTLLTVTKPTVESQYLSVTRYKVVPVSTNSYLMRNAFVEVSAMSTFIAYIRASARTAKDMYIYGDLLNQLATYTPANGNQTITINIQDISSITDPEKIQSVKTLNSNTIVTEMINTLREMNAPSTDYNDYGFTEIIDGGSLKAVLNSTLDVAMIVNTFATQLRSGLITEEERWAETISIPQKQLVANGFAAADVTKLVGYLMHKEKLQFGYFYEVATSFFDGSNLTQNDWLHFSYYIGLAKAYPCAVFKTNVPFIGSSAAASMTTMLSKIKLSEAATVNAAAARAAK